MTSTTVYTAAATDTEGAALFYTITGGADAARFTINSTSGAVKFVAVPNFEAPVDAGPNNVYDIIISAFDGSLTTDRSVAITVTDVAPAFSSGTTASVAEAKLVHRVHRDSGRRRGRDSGLLDQRWR